MPNRDGTGPEGRGARTGGGRGNCTNSSVPPRRGPGRRLGK